MKIRTELMGPQGRQRYGISVDGTHLRVTDGYSDEVSALIKALHNAQQRALRLNREIDAQWLIHR